MEFIMRPIGIIHSPFTDKTEMPIQASTSDAVGQVEVFHEFAEGLKDLDGFTHLHLLYVFNYSCGFSLMVKPFLDDHLRGLFATRHPCRPNPIGLSVVRLLALNEIILEVESIDMLDGTPLVDIKPYVPDFDIRSDVRTGWYTTRSRS